MASSILFSEDPTSSRILINVILHFGDWHGEPPLGNQVYSERVLTSRVPLLLRGNLGRTAGIELYTFGISPRGQKRRWRNGRFWRKPTIYRCHSKIVTGASRPLRSFQKRESLRCGPH